MADNRLYLQTQKHTLSASIALGDTSIALSSFNFPDGTAIVSGDLGTLNFATLEPGTTREEQITFTGLTGTTLTGVTRGIRFDSPYTQDTSLRVAHGAGAILVLANTVAFYDSFANKENDETINGTYSFGVVPNSTSQAVSGDDLVNLTQLNAAATGSANIDRLVIAGNAGETVATGDWVFLDPTDSEWKKTDASVIATTDSIKIGIAQGAGTDGNAIANGILVSGLDANQIGLTANNIFFLSDTAGDISSTPGTIERPIGIAISTTQIVFDPYFRDYVTAIEHDAIQAANGIISTTNPLISGTGFQRAQEIFAADAEASDTYVITLSPAPTALITGMTISFTANTANTGAATLNVNGLGAITIKKLHDIDLEDNDIESGSVVTVVYDGTNFQMTNPVANQTTDTTNKISLDSSEVETTATTTETVIATGTIPADALGTDNGVRVHVIFGENEAGAAATSQVDTGDTWTFRLKYGGTTVATLVISNGEAFTIDRISGEIFAYLTAQSSTSAQRGVIAIDMVNMVGHKNWLNTNTNLEVKASDYGTSTEDSTTQLDVELTIQFSTSSANNRFVKELASIELIS